MQQITLFFLLCFFRFLFLIPRLFWFVSLPFCLCFAWDFNVSLRCEESEKNTFFVYKHPTVLYSLNFFTIWDKYIWALGDQSTILKIVCLTHRKMQSEYSTNLQNECKLFPSEPKFRKKEEILERCFL